MGNAGTWFVIGLTALGCDDVNASSAAASPSHSGRVDASNASTYDLSAAGGASSRAGCDSCSASSDPGSFEPAASGDVSSYSQDTSSAPSTEWTGDAVPVTTVEPGGTDSGGEDPTVVSCTGTFGEPRLLFEDDGVMRLGTPNITGDELSIFYLEDQELNPGEDDSPILTRVVHRDRTSLSEPFSDPIAVPELDEQCPTETSMWSSWLSRDGLRFYWHCVPQEGPFEGELRVASRTSRTSAFTVVEGTFGNVGAAFGLSADELTLLSYPTKSDGNPSGDLGNATIVRYQRSSRDEPFASPTVVVDSDTGLKSPELGPDNTTLFGSRVSPTGPFFDVLVTGSLSASTGTFSSFTSDDMPAPSGEASDIGPTVSNDCKRIYFLRSFGLRLGLLVAERH